MSEILENALDSLRMGLTHHLDPDLKNSDKWAILELFHCIELILKERLYREHELLIYRNIDGPLDDDSHTVALKEAVARLANLGVELSDEYRKILFDLQKRRNRIEHHRFVPSKSHKHVLGKALKFIRYFLEEELDVELEDELDSPLFHEAKELMFEYDELVRKAEASVESARSRFDPKERELHPTGTCPECGNETVLVDGDDYGRSLCHYCNRRVHVRACERCGTYLPAEDLADMGICQNCFDGLVGE